jgi:hypothetical protein
VIGATGVVRIDHMTEANDGTRAGALQLTAAATVVVGVLPYIVLKIIWLAGGSLGVENPVVIEDGGFFALNLLTFCMDLVALLVALALVRPWGRRIPAGLILLPMWVATGLLVPISIQAPLGALAAVLGGAPVIPGDLVAGWVYLVVYTGFVCQGLGLTIAFIHHARHRWPPVFTARVDDGPPSPTRELQVFVARGTVLVAGILAILNLSWVLGSPLGLPPDVIARRSFMFYLGYGVNAAVAIAAAAGLSIVVGRRSGRPLWVPVTLAWIGSGAMFGWSMWTMLVVLTPNGFNAGGPGSASVVSLVSLFTLLTGLVAGLTGAFALAERVRS